MGQTSGGSTGEEQFRVLVTAGTYEFDNLGDVAMCQVAVARVRALRPDAVVEILAPTQTVLDLHDLGFATAVDDRPWHIWSRLVGRWQRRVRQPARLHELPFTSPHRFVSVAGAVRRLAEADDVARWVDRVTQADLVVICGQGAIHDRSGRRTDRLVHLISLASAGGVPSVALGQGIGPLVDPRLADQVARALPKLLALGIREDWGSVPTLERLGVDSARWTLTGDDAIALALERPFAADPGDHLGISLRDNASSAMPDGLPALVGSVIGSCRPDAHLELVSMMEKPPDISDQALLQQVAPDHPAGRTETVQTVPGALDAIERCRLVVTGTYHAAVFAQALGIPTVCLAGTDYYRQKMHGVLAQFGGGAGVVLDPGDEGFEAALAAEVVRWWDAPPEVRRKARDAAEAQAAIGAALVRERIGPVVQRVRS